jgi:hypothetical protein
MTIVLAVAVALMPPISESIHAMLYSGEQLARTLSQFVLMVFGGIVLALAIIEWGVRVYVARRRSVGTSAGQPHSTKES